MRLFNVVIFLFLLFSIFISCDQESGVTPYEPNKPFDHIIDARHSAWKSIYEFDQPGQLASYKGDGQFLGQDGDRFVFMISTKATALGKKFQYMYSLSVNEGRLIEYNNSVEKEVDMYLFEPYYRFFFHQKDEEEELIFVTLNSLASRFTPTEVRTNYNGPVIHSVLVNSTDTFAGMENYALTPDLDFTSFNITGEKGSTSRPSIYAQNSNILNDQVILYGDSQLKKEKDGDDVYYDPACAIFLEGIGWTYFVFYEQCYMCETESTWKMGIFTLEDTPVEKGFEDETVSLDGLLTAKFIKEIDLADIDDHHDPYYFENFTTARVKKVNENELLILFHLGAYYSLFRYHIDSQSLTIVFDNLLLPEYSGPYFVDFSSDGSLYFIGFNQRLYRYNDAEFDVIYEKGSTFESEASIIDFMIIDDKIIGMFMQNYTVESANIEGSISGTFGLALGWRRAY